MTVAFYLAKTLMECISLLIIAINAQYANFALIPKSL